MTDRDAITKAVEALKRSKEGWANAIELGIIPPAHRLSASILLEECHAAITALQEQPAQDIKPAAPSDLIKALMRCGEVEEDNRNLRDHIAFIEARATAAEAERDEAREIALNFTQVERFTAMEARATAAEERVKELRDALTLAGNRLHQCALDAEFGTREKDMLRSKAIKDWIAEGCPL